MKHRPALREPTVGHGEQVAELQHDVFALGRAQEHVVVDLDIRRFGTGQRLLVGAVVERVRPAGETGRAFQ